MGANHGGARPGAGRPSNQEKHQEAIATFTDLAARGLTQCFDNLCTLADGGFERTEVKMAPAGTLKRKDVVRDKDGEPLTDKNGKMTVVEVLLYPDLPADELVVIERKVITLAPDFRANEYLVDRVIGKPRAESEPDADGLNLAEALDQADADLEAFVEPDDGPASDGEAAGDE
jgi:hypothetical protein